MYECDNFKSIGYRANNYTNGLKLCTPSSRDKQNSCVFNFPYNALKTILFSQPLLNY